MLVETTGGDLGGADISKPEIADVVQDSSGHVEKIVVKKGLLFKKEIEVPADRVQSVEPAQDSTQPGKVVILAAEEEVESLAAVGTEALPPEEQAGHEAGDGLLHQIERAMPTETGLRAMEADNSRGAAHEAQEDAREGVGGSTQEESNSFGLSLGPGFLAGISGKDSSAVTTYAVDGAQVGYGHLWLMLLATPLLQAVQFACAKVGRIQQKGFAEILCEHYGLRVAVPAALVLTVANVGMVAANLVAIGSGLELITGLGWVWFILPVALALWYITVYQDFNSIKKVFLVMSLAFLTYAVTAVLSKPDWGAVLFNTLVPQVNLDLASISGAVALLGATISPYTLFWQVQGEKEEQRPGTRKQQLRVAGLDIASGVISSNLVAYFIIISSATTLYAGHKRIATAVDAAKSFEPLLGPLSKYLFAVGLIGAGLIAIPVLLASTSYAVAGTIGWPSGLSKKPWQSEGFYLIFTVGLGLGLVVSVLGIDPVSLMFWANVVNGVLTPVLVVLLLLVGNNRKIMDGMPFNKATNLGLWVTAALMTAGALLLFYGLATGQTS